MLGFLLYLRICDADICRGVCMEICVLLLNQSSKKKKAGRCPDCSLLIFVTHSFITILNRFACPHVQFHLSLNDSANTPSLFRKYSRLARLDPLALRRSLFSLLTHSKRYSIVLNEFPRRKRGAFGHASVTSCFAKRNSLSESSRVKKSKAGRCPDCSLTSAVRTHRISTPQTLSRLVPATLWDYRLSNPVE